MPDPVDTEALRETARCLNPGFPGVARKVIAAADEIDRLRSTATEHVVHSRHMDHRIATAEGSYQAEKYRRERVEQKLDRRNVRLRELEQDVESLQESRDTWKRLANDERDVTNRLRAVIENAPHAYLECTARGLDCRCWKADVL